MNLSAELCFKGVIETLDERVMPALGDPFATEAARLASLLMIISTNSLDDVVEIRVVENAAMRELFGDSLPAVADPKLAATLREAAASADPSLKISGLDAENARLRGVLVDLHTFVETFPELECRALDGRIWRMLRDFEAARAPRR